MMETICGIYKIENLVNGKIYIGKSVNIYRRWKKHKTLLNTRSHYNKHLRCAWDIYGEDNFEFSIIEQCAQDNDILSIKEKYYIELYSSNNSDFGYNMTNGGDGTFGLKWSDEQRKATSERMSGNKNPYYGTKKSESFKRQVSAKLKGRVSPMLNKHHSEDTKQRISIALKGENSPSCREIYCPELDEIFWGATEAFEKYGICRANIVACCRHRLKSAGKHPVSGIKLTWFYIDDINNSYCA